MSEQNIPARTEQAVTVVQPVDKRKSRPKYEPRWYVILHDDQMHTYQYVIDMVIKVFKVSNQEALLRAVEVERGGARGAGLDLAKSAIPDTLEMLWVSVNRGNKSRDMGKARLEGNRS